MAPRKESDCIVCGFPISDWTRETQYELCQACEQTEYVNENNMLHDLEVKHAAAADRIRKRYAAQQAAKFQASLVSGLDQDRADTVERMKAIAFGPFGR